MTIDRTRRALDLFEAAQELDASEREAFLDRACGGEEALRLELGRMLGADSAPDFLEFASRAPSAPEQVPAGRRVGPFRIVSTIGTGGMGIVYEAEQNYPKRRVALKMLRTDLISADRDRRFRSEVEFLARLDHPGIARVLEAGVHETPDGIEQPYFAVELVEGARDLLSWGREKDLRERLTLFVDVCDAIHHGHRQGVLHRDLKPANVLVGSNGIAKVIDFGVARALDTEDGAATRVTRTGHLIGTLHYMAPEQLGNDGHEVETRTDVYALGLLLYELVCGRAPFELDRRSMTEVADVIRKVTPPSLSSTDPELPADLNWVALRALEKDPERRYPSVADLAADLRRFLDYRPVEAGPPSRLYAVIMFTRRNWPMVSAAGIALVALLIGGIVSFSSLLRATVENDKFRSINDVLTDMFVSVRTEEGGYDVRAAELLDRAAARIAEEERPEIKSALWRMLSKSYFSLGLFERAETHGRAALELRQFFTPAEECDTVYNVGQALVRLDRADEARALLDRYMPASGERGAELTPEERFPLRQLDAVLLGLEGHTIEALKRLEELVAESEELLGDDESIASFELSLIHALLERERFSEADDRARALVDKLERLHGTGSEPTLFARAMLARTSATLIGAPDSIETYEALAADFARAYGADHPRTLVALNDLANLHVRSGQDARALPILQEVVRAREARDGPAHAETLTAKSNLASALSQLDPDAAESLYREGVATRQRLLGEDHPRTLSSQFKLARFLRQADRLIEAEPLLVDLVQRSEATLNDDDLELHEATVELGMLYLGQGRTEVAFGLLGDGWRGFRRRLGDNSARTLVVGNNYANALFQNEDWDSAVRVFTEILAGMRTTLPSDDVRQFATLRNLGIAHARRGEPGRSLELMREVLAWADEHLPKEHPKRIDAGEDLASALVLEGRYEEALGYFELALDAANLNVAVPDHQQSSFRLGYARCLRLAGRELDATREFERVIEMESVRVPGQSAWLAELREELSRSTAR